MKIGQFIYDDDIDAWSYTGVYLLSTLFPLIISLMTENQISVSLVMMINSISLLRDYAVKRHEKVTKNFLKKKYIGIALFVILSVYSVAAMLFTAASVGGEYI